MKIDNMFLELPRNGKICLAACVKGSVSIFSSDVGRENFGVQAPKYVMFVYSPWADRCSAISTGINLVTNAPGYLRSFL